MGFKINRERANVLGVVNINPIRKESIASTQESTLRYFYEPNPNFTDDEEAIRWLVQKPRYTINTDLLNDRFDYPIKKPSGTYRIITLGDSFTFGQFVNTKDNWTELLEDFLKSDLNCKNKFEVINLGMGGYDIQYSVERFKIRGEKYNPDLILWLLKNDDFYAINEETVPVVNNFINNLKQNGLIEKISTEGTNKIDGESMRKAIGNIIKKYGVERILDYQRVALEEINKYYSKKLIIFNIYPVDPNIEKLILDLVNKNQNYLFINNTFTSYDMQKSSFFPYDNHPNQKGHQIIARGLLNYLVKNKIIPCDYP